MSIFERHRKPTKAACERELGAQASGHPTASGPQRPLLLTVQVDSPAANAASDQVDQGAVPRCRTSQAVPAYNRSATRLVAVSSPSLVSGAVGACRADGRAPATAATPPRPARLRAVPRSRRHGHRRRGLPRRRLGPRPGHEPVRRAGRGPARLLGRPDPRPATTPAPRSCAGGDAGSLSGCGCSTTATGSTSRRCRARVTGAPAATSGHALARRRPARPGTQPNRQPPSAGQPQGRWQRLDDATHYVLWDLGPTPEEAGLAGRLGRRSPLRLRQSGAVAHLTTWRGVVDLPRPLGALGLDAVHRSTAPAVDSTPCSVIETHRPAAAMDKYLWGIAEVPASSSRPPGAAGAGDRRAHLRRQAGRPRPDADPGRPELDRLGEGDRGQAFNGQPGANLRWKAAVDATSGQVVAVAGDRRPDRRASTPRRWAATPRTSATSGASRRRSCAPSTTRRWDAASSNPAAQAVVGHRVHLGDAWPPSSASRSISTISVPPRGAAARTAGVKVVGIQGGAAHRRRTSRAGTCGRRSACSRRASRSRVRRTRRRGRDSRWSVTGTATAATSPAGSGHGQVALRMTEHGRRWVKRFRYGTGRRRAGRRRLGRRRRPTTSASSAPAAGCCAPGRPAARRHDRPRSAGPATAPVVGSWTGTTLGIGVVRRATWLLRRTATPGAAQTVPLRPGRRRTRSSATGTANGATGSASCATASGCCATGGRPAAPRRVVPLRPAGRPGPSSATGTATAPAPPGVVRGRRSTARRAGGGTVSGAVGFAADAAADGATSDGPARLRRGCAGSGIVRGVGCSVASSASRSSAEKE